VQWAGAAALPAGKLFASNNKRLSKGDAAILRLAAAIEFIEADLWQQYNELGGQVDHNDNPNPGNPAYIAALQQLDGDMPQYISDNTDDEISHRDFLNAYLTSKARNPSISPSSKLFRDEGRGASAVDGSPTCRRSRWIPVGTFAPAAFVGGRVWNWVKSMGCAPLDVR